MKLVADANLLPRNSQPNITDTSSQITREEQKFSLSKNINYAHSNLKKINNNDKIVKKHEFALQVMRTRSNKMQKMTNKN